MDAKHLISDCQKKDPKKCYLQAIDLLEDKQYRNQDANPELTSTIELILESLIRGKSFDQANHVVQTLLKRDIRILNHIAYTSLPELIYYHLYHREYHQAEQYLRLLAPQAHDDLLLFAHLLDVFDAYGCTEIVSQVVVDLLTSNPNLDKEDKLLLESYIVSIEPFCKNQNLVALRQGFIHHCLSYNIMMITAESIFDALSDYIENFLPCEFTEVLLLEENSFRTYLTTLLDIEFLDTYEYAASFLWGSTYFFHYLEQIQLITPAQSAYNLDIISRAKAFLLVNIPWDGIWRLNFITHWKQPHVISNQEIESERDLFAQNLYTSMEDIEDRPLERIFTQQMEQLSYGKHLKHEMNMFEKASQWTIRYTLKKTSKKQPDSLATL